MKKTFGIKEEDVQYHDRPGAYLIAVKNGCLAAVRTPKGYFLPGGGIDSGETCEQCIIRECMEEIGCPVEIDGFFCSAETYCHHSELGYFHPIQYYYFGRIGKKTAEPLETDHSLHWVPEREIEWKLNIEQQIWAVKKYFEALLPSMKGCYNYE